MFQVRTCVSVHCDRCGDALGAPLVEEHYRTENVARDAATAHGWRVGSNSRLLCSACAPVLACEVWGHEFSAWRHPVTPAGQPAPNEYRHCWRCCRHESRPAQNHPDGGEPR